jgi:actin-related protein 8
LRQPQVCNLFDIQNLINASFMEPIVQPKLEADVQVMDVDLPDTGRSGENQAVDVEEETKVPLPQSEQTSHLSQAQPTPGGYEIDVCFEASKLPLDVAIFNSARAAGGDEKIRKYLQAVLVIGGSALIPGMAHALESRSGGCLYHSLTTLTQNNRLQAIATPLVPNMEKVQIIPPPKEVDPRVLTWKGAAVLGKMDSISELWVTPSDWVSAKGRRRHQD